MISKKCHRFFAKKGVTFFKNCIFVIVFNVIISFFKENVAKTIVKGVTFLQNIKKVYIFIRNKNLPVCLIQHQER